MSAVESRLAELGLSLPAVVPPLAAYQPAVQWLGDPELAARWQGVAARVNAS